MSGRYPIPNQGYPILGWEGGIHHPDLNGMKGVSLSGTGVPHRSGQDLPGGYSIPGWGTPGWEGNRFKGHFVGTNKDIFLAELL